MAPRQQQAAPAPAALPPPRAAGTLPVASLALGAAAPGVAVPPRDAPQPVRSFGAAPAAGEAVAAGWATGGSTTVALDSPGVSGLPRCALLEPRGFAGLRVAPHQGQQRRGRPTRAGHDGQGL